MTAIALLSTACSDIFSVKQCDPAQPNCVPVAGDVSGILTTINTTMANLTTTGDTWIATLSSLVSNLQHQGFTSAATFVRDTLQNGIARVGVEFRCNADFTVGRIRRGLEALVDAIKHAKGTPRRARWTCSRSCAARRQITLAGRKRRRP